MRLAVHKGAALVVGAAAVALARADPVSAAKPGEAGNDRIGEGAQADRPQPLLRE